mmetsp:Transcript_57965/g.186163  ORF Transcript_57965/g.186163 Transcript_57965/m.186163 type:complete len:212 (-) Transcript_57965:523-1158(-)
MANTPSPNTLTQRQLTLQLGLRRILRRGRILRRPRRLDEALDQRQHEPRMSQVQSVVDRWSVEHLHARLWQQLAQAGCSGRRADGAVALGKDEKDGHCRRCQRAQGLSIVNGLRAVDGRANVRTEQAGIGVDVRVQDSQHRAAVGHRAQLVFVSRLEGVAEHACKRCACKDRLGTPAEQRPDTLLVGLLEEAARCEHHEARHPLLMPLGKV